MAKRDEEYYRKKAEKGILFMEIMSKKELLEKKGTRHSARSAIATHARNLYMSSGLPRRCAICGYDKHVDVAHIRRVSSFSDETLIGEINSMTNLMPLCPNHHWEFDHDLLEFDNGFDEPEIE